MQTSPLRRSPHLVNTPYAKALARKTQGKDKGFSLVEVVLALGIVSFAFVGLFGLLPVGLNSFNNSIDSTVQSQIAESVLSQVKQAKFTELRVKFHDANSNANNMPPYLAPNPGFYFDDQGKPVANNPTTQKPANYVYTAGVQVYYDSTIPLRNAPSSNTIASGVYTPASPQPMATIVVTVSKISTPRNARIYTSYIDNNGF